MGGSTTTTVNPSPPSAQENAYYQSQQDLAAKQLEILSSQQDFNKSYMDQIKPILDQQTQLLSQQLAAQNDPTQKALTDATTKQQLQALQDQADLEPLQKQVLQKQLQDSLNGTNATPEQAAQIDAATSAAFDKGQQQVSQFSSDALDQLRQNLSPSLGLRPTDTPITDRGGLIAREGIRQVGQLSSSLAEANANAKLNYPLAASGVEQAGANFAGSLQQASDQFQAGLQDAAATNRLRLLGAAGDTINSGTNTGIGLVTGSRGNPLSFQQGSTTTSNSSPGIGTFLSGAGGLATGLGALGVKLNLSDARAKTDIKTEGFDNAGHRWVRFKYRADPTETEHIGVIAQEAEKISPEAVLTDGTGTKYVNYKRLNKVAA